MDSIIIPFGPFRGKNKEEDKRAAYTAFAKGLQAIQAKLDYKMGSRDWCYFLEDHGLLKPDFDKAEDRISIARKEGYLPVDFTLEDGSRSTSGDHGTEQHDKQKKYLERIWNFLEYQRDHYAPVRWVDYQPYYVELLVEKLGLTSLFAKQCKEFRISVSNGKGDTDINSIARMHLRFQEAEERGQRPVLLYCGDHDPKGLLISDILPKRFSDGVGRWFTNDDVLEPIDLEIVRFGLNADTIETLGLSKIPNLATGGTTGKTLDDPKHPDHFKPYVQNYLRDHGVWKCEANALMVRPVEGRQLFQDALTPYINFDGIKRYEADCAKAQKALGKVLPDFLVKKLEES